MPPPCRRRIEASALGMDIRYVVASLKTASAEHIYDTLYRPRGRVENRIKMRKAQLASDRTSCRRANANQLRLILRTAAFWLDVAHPAGHPDPLTPGLALRRSAMRGGAKS